MDVVDEQHVDALVVAAANACIRRTRIAGTNSFVKRLLER
jgi:hypothetical protein